MEENPNEQISGNTYSKYALLVFGKAKGRNNSVVVSGHDFPDLIREHLRVDTENVQRDLDRIYNPLIKDRECFIDLRYYNEDHDEITEDLFSEWKESYIRVHNWLNNQLDNIEIESYEVVS